MAGPGYRQSAFHQWLWGRNRRTEWTTPVSVPILWLDSVYGGLQPYKTGGGNESRSLRLRTGNGKEYALRSINKSRDSVTMPIFKHTFVADIIKDGVSMQHPYGALALPIMQQKAGIYHTLPTVVYLPKQPSLDTFNNRFGNDLYLFEQKPEGNWSEADNLGNFSNFIDTWELIDTLQQNNNGIASQYAFVKERLFDMLIGDWDRNEGNWSWGVRDSAGKTMYIPVPRDRDQAFYAHNGVLLNATLNAAGLNFMQHFDYVVKDVPKLNLEARDLDRFFTNALVLSDWIRAAKSLQQALTDTVIEQSVRQLPPEIFAVSGNELIAKLKSRRAQLVRFAKQYYLFLAKEVEITGTEKRDYFEVNRMPTGETMVTVFSIDSSGQKEPTAYYERVFKPVETKEIRLFGIGGKDVYDIHDHSKTITVRVIGGFDKDSVIQTGHHCIHVYDDRDNTFQTTKARKHLSGDSAVHAWNYEWFNYDSKGFLPILFYNNADRFFVGLSYRLKTYKWRKDPFAGKQSIGINYSISQNAISVTYSALFPKAVAGWDLSLLANYDAIRWTNFYGTGNDTKLVSNDINYYRLRSEEWLANVGLRRNYGKSTVSVDAYYQRVKNRNDSDRYPSKVFYSNPDVFKPNQYAGVQLTYSWASVNDSVLPVKGFTFWAQGAYADNFTQKEFFQKYDAHLQAYIPFNKYFSLAVHVGGTTIVNDDVLNSGQPYEHAIIGGPRNLRGYRRERFWGKTAYYNNNELRFITDFRSHIMNGRIGLLGFFDNGRVWMPGESSNKLHISYGPGLLLSPFNKFCVVLTYGITEEIRLFQLRLNTLF